MAEFKFLIDLKATVLLVLIWLHPVFSAGVCPKGTQLYTPQNGQYVCLDYLPGKFMPDDSHTHRECYPCTEIRNRQLEILVSPCDKTHDTEIHCIDGYYRTQPSYPNVRGQCRRCTVCPSNLHIGRQCQTFSDTVCCQKNYNSVSINKDGKPECGRQCGRGQMLDPMIDECVGCPHGTYMDEERHKNIGCKNCEVPKSENEKILSPCSPLQPTVIGCRDGFYRQRQTDSSSLCVPCTKCHENTDGNIYVGRACDRSGDTVCCPAPSMTVPEDPFQPVCLIGTSEPTADHKSSGDDDFPMAAVVSGVVVPVFACIGFGVCLKKVCRKMRDDD